MSIAHSTPAFWKEYLSSLLASLNAGVDGSSLPNQEILERENLGPTGKLLTQLRINNLLKGVSKPPVPLPDPRGCDRRKCPLGWLENVCVTADPTTRTAALSFRRRSSGVGASFEYLIRVNPSAFPPNRGYLNMVVAHEIAHLLFIQEHPSGGLIQYLNLAHNPGKTKAEWLIHELAREVVAPTRLLEQYISPLPRYRPALAEMVRVSRLFGMPERELVSALLHSNAYLSWLRIEPQARMWLAQNFRHPRLFFKHMGSRFPHPLLSWAKSLVIILDFTRGGAVKARKYIGKLWGRGPDFTPDDLYQIPQRVRVGFIIDKLIAQCSEKLNLATPRRLDHAFRLLLNASTGERPTFDKCPELAKLARWQEHEHVIEVAVKKTAWGHRAYILIRPQQTGPENALLKD